MWDFSNIFGIETGAGKLCFWATGHIHALRNRKKWTGPAQFGQFLQLGLGGRFGGWWFARFVVRGPVHRWWAVVVVVVACVLSWALVLAWLVTWPATSLSSWLVVVVSGW